MTTVLLLAGPDAERFLQGQVTLDVRNIGTEPKLGALCNNKGRVLFSFYLAKTTDGFAMEVPQALVELALKTLNKYAQFSKVEIKPLDPGSHSLHSLGRDDQLAKIRNGIAIIDDPKTSGEFTPHELNYHAIGAVSFEKGCYTGQEIIARMHHLGKLKKHLYHYVSDELPLFDEHAAKIVSLAKNEKNQYEMLVVASDEEWKKFIEQ